MYRKMSFDKPFIHITIPMAIGIVFYYYVDIGIYVILISLATLICLYLLLFFNKRNNITIIYLIFFVLGLFLMYEKTEKSVLTNYIGKNVDISGVVLEIKEKEECSNIVLKGEYVYVDGVKLPISEKVNINIYGDMEIEKGYKLNISGVLKEPNRNKNPKLFNYKLYLETKDIYTMMNSNYYAVDILSEGNLKYGQTLRCNFQTYVEETFNKYLGVEKARLVTSILLGDISYLEDIQQIKYRELGLAHLMAVSGLHIGIVTSFLIFLFTNLGIQRKINLTITILMIWLYGYLIGYPPSVLRSLIMFTTLFYSQMHNKYYDNINILSFAAFILLLYNPLWLFSVGFQLSFLATFFIITLSNKMREWFYPRYGKIYNLLYGIFAVQIGIAPIIAYYFNSISPISILANFILIPLMSLVVILGFLLLIVSFISNMFAAFIGGFLGFLLTVVEFLSNSIHLLPIGTIKVKSPSIVDILSYYLMVFCIFDIIKIRKYSKHIYENRVIIYCLMIFILLFSLMSTFGEEIEIRFIDVGQGDAILIKLEGKNFLIDTGGNVFGNFDVGENILVPYLIKDGIFSMDGVFITHFHEDHANSLPYLLDNIEVKRIFIGYEREESKLYSNIIESANIHNVPIYVMKSGDTLNLGKSVYIKVLNPSDEIIAKYGDNENNLSMVLLLNSYDYKTLFTGDIEKEIERLLVDEYEKVNFLKVPHHGSNTSSNEEFLDSFSPNYAFVSVGNNNFGHPNEDVLNRFEKRGIKVFRTDESGMIRLSIKPNQYHITTFIVDKYNIGDLINKYIVDINILILYSILWYIFIRIDDQFKEELNANSISRTYR